MCLTHKNLKLSERALSTVSIMNQNSIQMLMASCCLFLGLLILPLAHCGLGTAWDRWGDKLRDACELHLSEARCDNVVDIFELNFRGLYQQAIEVGEGSFDEER